VGSPDDEGDDWPPALISRDQANQVARTSYPWLLSLGASYRDRQAGVLLTGHLVDMGSPIEIITKRNIIITIITFLDPGHYSSHVLQQTHSHHCTASLEWPATWTPHLFFTSTIIIANHKTLIFILLLRLPSTGLSTRNWSSIYLQKLLPWLTGSSFSPLFALQFHPP